MSYILYINGKRIRLADSKPIAQTKQVNDLAKFASRQTNFTNKFIATPCAENVRNLDRVGLVGNQSNLPYERAVVDLFDFDTGECLIYKGWGNITQTTDGKGYEIYVYDGNIDFYKAVEDLTLTDVGISDLNHIKNLANVVASFDGDLNYMYIIADYNGNNVTPTGALNIDYQLPSARSSYLWDRVFQYTGFTYSGSVFTSEKFLNHWMTFPKPVPTLEPIVSVITSQNSEIRQNTVAVPTGTGIEYVHYYYSVLWPSTFDDSYAVNNSTFTTIKTAGVFRIKATGSFSNNNTTSSFLTWTLKSSTDEIKETGSFDASINTANINAAVGDKLYLGSLVTGYISGSVNNPLSGSMTTTLDYLIGYDANFEEALLEFKAKDFVNEIMQAFGLTMFKDKYTNNVDFRSIKEIVQSDVIEDWSGKFNNRVSEKYIFSNYAQKNTFKYRYNDENVSYNDGFITVNNKNLATETPIVNSKIYSPERLKVFVVGLQLNSYKFWNKEIKDDNTVDYKELTGRYYFLRAKPHTFSEPIAIGSKSLNTETTVATIQREDYSRLNFQEIIYDNYGEIESLLDKSKTLEAEFNLKAKDVANFTFKNLIYVEQRASYFLVNKILSFIKGKPTKCEVIEVDYKKTLTPPENNPGTYITITDIELSGCNLIIHFDTDADLPANILVTGQPNSFGVIPPPTLPPNRYFNAVVDPVTNTIDVTVIAGGYWDFTLELTVPGVLSNHYLFENTMICEYVPPAPDLSFITITHLQTLSMNTTTNTRRVRVDFDTDLEIPNVITVDTYALDNFSIPQYITATSKYLEVDLPLVGSGPFGPVYIEWFLTLGYGTVFSQSVNVLINF
ncbi:hypothetical protein EV143_11817 [Flavobacterium chryseum]|uniref:hypothetical protein n=1 Tax=Flavobacterium sp. P3160 TaxID=2512113 RepID=UPI00105BDF9C|nr:hypothetical protein [Flavobacterium sp. P3160]TDO68833.1 hypothetical protein EV143_11817 [Flavobacterium sp. P3160]